MNVGGCLLRRHRLLGDSAVEAIQLRGVEPGYPEAEGIIKLSPRRGLVLLSFSLFTNKYSHLASIVIQAFPFHWHLFFVYP